MMAMLFHLNIKQVLSLIGDTENDGTKNGVKLVVL